jgi:hypothetical protein
LRKPAWPCAPATRVRNCLDCHVGSSSPGFPVPAAGSSFRSFYHHRRLLLLLLLAQGLRGAGNETVTQGRGHRKTPPRNAHGKHAAAGYRARAESTTIVHRRSLAARRSQQEFLALITHVRSRARPVVSDARVSEDVRRMPVRQVDRGDNSMHARLPRGALFQFLALRAGSPSTTIKQNRCGACISIKNVPWYVYKYVCIMYCNTTAVPWYMQCALE